jgi:biotin operon repressor
MGNGNGNGQFNLTEQFNPIVQKVAGPHNLGSVYDPEGRLFGGKRKDFGSYEDAVQAAQVEQNRWMLTQGGGGGGGFGPYGGGPGYIIPGYDPTQFEGGSEQVRRAEAEGRLGIPALPPVPEMRLAPEMPIRMGKELISAEGLQVAPQEDLVAAQARTDTGAIAARPSDTRPELGEYAATAIEDIGEIDPAQLLGGPSAIVEAAQGTLDNKLAVAATTDMDERATVQFQLGELGKTIQDGQPLPAWASGAARAADAYALKRGLGASSMAVHARTLALQESGVDIAKADAESYRRLQELNLTNRQQSVVTNANNLAALETKNLDSRLTASVNNARNTLSIDLGNLTSRQRGAELSFQGYTQKLFTDTAAVNAAAQFGAKSKNDVDMFFGNLDTSVANMNANRVEAIERDNARQRNSMTEFYQAQKLSRDTFNINTTANIRAANTKWFQSTATVQNSNQMLANSYAAQSELGLRSMEYNALWQKRRDDAQMLYDSTERDLERVAQAAAIAQQAAIAKSAQKASRTASIFSTIGTIAGAAITAGCWVAREVYGNDAQEVYRFRWWLEREAPKWFNRLYKKRGEKLAYFIKDKPILKKLIKVWMDTKVKRVERTWRLNRLKLA